MPNTLTTIFTSTPASEPVESPHPNTGAYVLGTQLANGTWQVVHTLVTKTSTPATITGRLKNFPAVAASVVASGNVLNNILAMPTGTSAVASSATAINATVSSNANATAYRLLSSATAGGTYGQLYQGAAASFAHTGLTAGTTYYYEWQYVGGGYYDDSALSGVFSGATSALAGRFALLGIGDSIEKANQATVEAGYAVDTATTAFQTANGTTGNTGGQTSTERAVGLLNAAYPGKYDAYTIGYPGKTSFYFKRNYLAACLNTIDFTKYDAFYIVLAFGANDLIYPDQASDSVAPADIYANIVSIAQSLAAVNAKVRIFISPTLNRTYNNPSPNGPQDPLFANFDDKRQALNRLLLNNLNTYAAGAANVFAEPIGLANMCFGYPNAETGDGSHPTIKGQTEIGLERARMVARYANLTLAAGNGTAPVAPVAPGTPGSYSTTTGFVAWTGGDGQAAVDSTNAKRLYKTSSTSGFGGTAFANVLARNTPGSAVQWQYVAVARAGAGDTQLVTATTLSTTTHYTQGIFSVYWNGSNYSIFEGATQLFTATLSVDTTIQVIATDKIRAYNVTGGSATLLATSTASVPTADVYLFAEMAGVPVNGNPQIIATQWFPASAVAAAFGAGTRALVGAYYQNTATDANGRFVKTNTTDDFSAQLTNRDKVPAASVVGMVLTVPGITPAATGQRAALIGIGITPASASQATIRSIIYALYWDATVIRVFDSSSGNPALVVEIPFNTASSNFTIVAATDGWVFNRDGAQIAKIATNPAAHDALINMVIGLNNFIPATCTLAAPAFVPA